MNNKKSQRILELYSKFMNEKIINKSEEAINFEVNERSIQRDIHDIRRFLDKQSIEKGLGKCIVYDRKQHGYKLENIRDNKLNNGEILAICKILLDSRAFTKKNINKLLDKIIDCCRYDKDKKIVIELMENEKYHYVEPNHECNFINELWTLGIAIKEKKQIEVSYFRLKDKSIVKRILNPLAIMFSEYYFYLTAFIYNKETKKDFDVLNDINPTIYRIDRIKHIKVLNQHFKIPYANRFEEGEFRKRIQFMFGGKLRKIKFIYSGLSVESVLDRLPTAKIVKGDEEKYLIEAEVFGDGIDMWIRSQGNNIEVLEG